MLKKSNIFILLVPILIFSLGFVTLLSTSQNLVRSHLFYFVLGYMFLLAFSFIDYALLKFFWKYIYIFTIIILLITYFFAEARLGAGRWLSIGGFSFQPSEFAKIGVLAVLASYMVANIKRVNNLKFLLISVGLFTPPALLVLIQPDLGTSLVYIALFMGLLFYSNVSKFYFLLLASILGIFSTPVWHLLQEYQKKRILVFLNPQLDVLGAGYNVIQSIISVGSGGIMGKGFGRGTQASLEFLPAHWTDFIFASFAEEWGFLGVFVLIGLYVFLLLNILYVSSRTDELFGKLLSVGVFFILFTQFTINVGMNMGLMPVTGVTLPLVSYGGSSMLVTLILLGLVNSIYIRSKT